MAALEGQGQDELFECIAGVRRYEGGSVLARGKELTLRHAADAIAAGVVLVPANRMLALLQQRSIQENIALPAFGSLFNWGLVGARGTETGAGRDRPSADRHARRFRAPTPERRQSAEGRHRALACGGLRYPAVLIRPEDRHRHQASNLCAGARACRLGCGGAPVHL